MDRGLPLIACASVAGLLILAGLARFTEPPLVPLSELTAHAGTTVRTDGIVLLPRGYESGWSRCLLSDGAATIDVEARQPMPASAGDRVRVRGLVTATGHRLELAIQSADDVEILVPWREGHIPLQRLLLAPWAYRGAGVATTGILERTAATNYLSDEWGAGRLRLLAALLPPAGSRLVVEGLFAYDESNAHFRLEAEHVEAIP